MNHLHEHGYPVPEVFSASATEMEMARAHGPTMLTALVTDPDSMEEHIGQWVALLDRLHTIPAPDWLPRHRFADPEAPAVVLHLDLHPGNIILTEDGPVVIDWTCARAGDAGLDAAKSYVILAGAELPGEPNDFLATARDPMLARLRRDWDDSVVARLAAAARDRLDGANTLDVERDRVVDHLATTFDGLAPAS